ncbi:response regulator transcription factor, partial [Candidatus Roizmanbacteria bacterium]|nr:response regulator transcription factor [Candidatus Roizmanbacteria bacterium]
MHILIIEDDERIAGNIKKILESADFQTTIAANGEEGQYLAEEETYDVIILDWMLPDRDGIEICKKIRQKKNTTPVIMLTAKSQLENKIEGLNVGADDYLTKPFEGEELLARVRALIRRQSGKSQPPLIKIDRLEINTNTTAVKLNGNIISLAPKEYALLEYLAVNNGKVIDRMTLLHHVWGEDIDEF